MYAVRISMSIPFFFAAVKDDDRHAVFVDGGVSWNYPIPSRRGSSTSCWRP
ncbi:MAG TPA: patatin-like phospholipase family protein [Vicinamibacteria bacterium]|nr:patatin-like phospholipase family protein [Vicinamibacteria bacterium]